MFLKVIIFSGSIGEQLFKNACLTTCEAQKKLWFFVFVCQCGLMKFKQFWNDMRMSKWYPTFHFWLNYPLKCVKLAKTNLEHSLYTIKSSLCVLVTGLEYLILKSWSWKCENIPCWDFSTVDLFWTECETSLFFIFPFPSLFFPWMERLELKTVSSKGVFFSLQEID